MINAQAGADASADHTAAFLEGERLASFTGRSPGGADVLVGLLRAGGGAARLLAPRGVTAARLEPVLSSVRPDPPGAVASLHQASHSIAAHLGAAPVSSLHLMLAILRAGGSGVELLRLAGVDPAQVRAVVMRALNGPGRHAERIRSRTPEPVVPASHREQSVPRSAERTRAAHAREPLPADVAEAPLLAPIDPPASPVLHREREIGRVLDLLHASAQRIPCIVGEPGSGRTAVLSAVAAAEGGQVLAANPGAASAGTGALVLALHHAAGPDAIIALDGVGLLGGEGSDGPVQLLASARVGRRWLLVATPADLRRWETSAPDLCASLELIPLPGLAPDALFEIIETGLESLVESTQVRFTQPVARALLRLSSRYPSERTQPGRALAIAQIVAARATRLARTVADETDVAHVIADAASVPARQLMRTDDERFRTLEARLAERVVGHEEARHRIAEVLRRSYAGFRGRRPLASFLLLGPTGVGKTETARAIADALFDGESALVRIDLSEYNEPHTIARLIGSPPGYVGHEDGGQLTEAVRRRPACVVLLDEMEKAHREVLLALLQLLEDGRLTDGRGRTVDFTAAAVVMTSNLGSELFKRSRTPVANNVLAVARSRLPAELWNRIDEVLCYAPLSEPELRTIVGFIARASSARLEGERGIRFHVDDSVVSTVLAAEPDRALGARPLRRAFERLVEGPIANEILAGTLRAGATLQLHCDARGELVLALDR